jgi:hypothetical protein
MGKRGFKRSYRPRPDDNELQWLEDGANLLIRFAIFGVTGILRGVCKIAIGIILLLHEAFTRQH